MASVFEEILSETVHFRIEPAGTSCSAEAVGDVGKTEVEDAARKRRENITMSLLFIGEPRRGTRARLSGVRLLFRLQPSDTHLASAPASIELPVEADIEKSSTIMLSKDSQRQLKIVLTSYVARRPYRILIQR